MLRRVLWILRLLALASALGFCLVSAAFALGPFNWAAELMTHFRVQAAIAGVVIAVACASLRLHRTALATCAFVAFHVIPMLPYLIPAQPPTPTGQPQIRLMQINVLTGNRDHLAVEQAILAANPDIVGLVEVNRRWLAALAPLHARYPYRIEHPQDDNFGIALFSRFPLDNLQLRPLAVPGLQMITGEFTLGSTPITVAVAHPVPPSGRSLSALRNRQFVRLSEILKESEGREIILLGDLNTSPWSPVYYDFEQAAGLRNSARGFGLFPTWPSGIPPLMIPLDHCLISPGLRATTFKLGPHIGSDHLPVLIEISPVPATTGEITQRTAATQAAVQL